MDRLSPESGNKEVEEADCLQLKGRVELRGIEDPDCSQASGADRPCSV